MNIIKKKLGPYIVYFSISGYESTRYSHRHSDKLSYVVFFNGSIFFIDPGRQFYSSRYGTQHHLHNGLSANIPLDPMYRFFYGLNYRNATTIYKSEDVDKIKVICKNHINKLEKTIFLMYESDNDQLVITESVQSKKKTNFRFVLNYFQNDQLSFALKLNEKAINCDDHKFEFKASTQYGLYEHANRICVETNPDFNSESKLNVFSKY